MPEQTDPDHEPAHGRDPAHDYGPAGYLPQRAAQRARKIVLREQMGLGWPIAAVAAAIAVAVVGAVFLLTRGGPPPEPFVAVGQLDDVDPAGAATLAVPDRPPVVVVRVGGGARGFLAPETQVSWCPASGHLEGADGTVWALTGRRLGGPGGSLTPLPMEIHAGTIYANPSAPLPPPAPRASDMTPQCDVE